MMWYEFKQSELRHRTQLELMEKLNFLDLLAGIHHPLSAVFQTQLLSIGQPPISPI